MDRVRTAVIGCGKIGAMHADALAALERSAFSAVCDTSEERAVAFGERHGVRAYTAVAEMIRAERIGMVSICTPHPVHHQAVVIAAAAGAHCLVEKPLASDLGACDRIIDACSRAGVRLGVMSQRRWYPPHLRMKAAIDSGAIGAPVLAVVSVLGWRSEDYFRADSWRGMWATEGGGVLVNQAPHQLDLMQWFMGPIDELSGYHANVNHPSIEVEDTAVAVVRFRSGALGNIVASNSQKPGLHWRIDVHGSNGASVGARTEGAAMGKGPAGDPARNDLWTVPGQEDLLETWQAADRAVAAAPSADSSYHLQQVDDFLDAILTGREPAVGGEDGRRVAEIFTAIYRSQRDGRPVTFPLQPEPDGGDFDGRLTMTPSQRGQE